MCMGPIYDHAKLPADRKLVDTIADAQERLHRKLAALDVDRTDLSGYNKAYVRRYQAKLHSNLQKFAYILAWALATNRKPLHQTVLLDYGGGAGILSLLAVEAGVGTVIYNDIYDVSCLDAETIGHAVRGIADHYVCGDIDDVIGFMEDNSLSCDVLVASDVIEHVHDVDGFFRSLHGLSGKHLSMVMSTHANPLNPVLRRLLAKKQRSVEYLDSEHTPGHKNRDSLKSYLGIRRDLIREACDGALPDAVVERLARATRGMAAPGIRAAVATYQETHKLPPLPEHPTNTCDPLTGNWADRLADPQDLRERLSAAGFEVRIRSGYYGRPTGLAKTLIARALDMIIRVSGYQGVRLAPFFLLHAAGYTTAPKTVPAPQPAEEEARTTLA